MRQYKNLNYSDDFTVCYGSDNKKLKKIILHKDTKMIEKNAFSCFQKLKKVVFNDNLETIQEEAFSGCRNLVTIENVNSLKSISPLSFAHCEQLEFDFKNTKIESIGTFAFADRCAIKNIVLPKTLKSLEYGAFEWCIDLEFTDLSNTKISILPERCFSFCKKLRTFCPRRVKLPTIPT